MTICFESSYDAARFFAKCMYKGECKDNTLPIWDEVHMICNFTQIEVKGRLGVEETEALLKEKKVKYKWVSQY